MFTPCNSIRFISIYILINRFKISSKIQIDCFFFAVIIAEKIFIKFLYQFLISKFVSYIQNLPYDIDKHWQGKVGMQT